MLGVELHLLADLYTVRRSSDEIVVPTPLRSSVVDYTFLGALSTKLQKILPIVWAGCRRFSSI